MSHLTLTPAYGRDYKAKADVLKDFLQNKDFELHAFTAGGYINYHDIRDMARKDGTTKTVNIRYKRRTMVMVLTVDKDFVTFEKRKFTEASAAPQPNPLVSFANNLAKATNEANAALAKAISESGVPHDKVEVLAVGPEKVENVTAKVLGLSREAKLQALLKDVVNACDLALASLDASLRDADNATLPGYTTRMARRERLENAYKAISAARLEGF